MMQHHLRNLDQEGRMRYIAALDRFRRDRPAPVTLKIATNIGRRDAEALGFDRDAPPGEGDVITVDNPEVAFELLRRGWAAEVSGPGA